MGMVDWYVEGVEFGNCNCDYGCPCQFESRPTQGNCRGFEVVRIDKGHFGDVPLDGLRAALLYAWPGADLRGQGRDAGDHRRARRRRAAAGPGHHPPRRRDREAATHWWVFHAMSSTVHEPIFKPIEFEVDIEQRRARVVIPGVLESSGRPIRSPATGEEHRVRIDIPNGIEFEIAEIGSASTKASGAIELDLDDTYGQFSVLRHSGAGVVSGRA